MKPTIIPYRAEREYSTSERCFINELLREDDQGGLTMARARVESGVTTAWHRLSGTTERYIILEGRGRVEIGDNRPEPVGPGDVVYIPPDTPQRITNIGESDLIFLCVCTPGFDPKKYVNLESEADTQS